MDVFMFVRLVAAVLVAVGCLTFVRVAYLAQVEHERRQVVDRDWQRMWHERIWNPEGEIR